MVFTFDRDPYGIGNIRKKKTFEIEPGLTILVGCNGSGKTTLIHEIDDWCKHNDVPSYHFNNLTDDHTNSHYMIRNETDISYVGAAWSASEGERTMLRIQDLAPKLGHYILTKHSDAENLFVLLDALGSGFSIDSIIQVKEQLFYTILESKPENMNVYIIVAANEYELCVGERCFYVQECRYREFKTYNSYKKFILKSREKRDRVG